MREDLSLTGFLTNEIPCKALMHLSDTGESFSQRMVRDIDTTYAHNIKTVNRLESRGLLRSNKEGRKRMLELTEKGERVAEAVENLFDVVDDVGEDL